MRCLEQIRVNQGYAGAKVIMGGIASGLVLGNLGNTHCCFEDIGVLSSIPNIAIVSPADCAEVAKIIDAALEYPNSVYIRLMGENRQEMVYHEDYSFEIGKAITLYETDNTDKFDVTVFSTGTMVSKCLKSVELLEKEDISVRLVNMHTIKPLDNDIVKKSCQDSKLIITVEEHNIYGGLGTAVAQSKAVFLNSPPQIMIGLPDKYGKGAEYSYLLDKYGLTTEKIAQKIISEVNEINK